MNSFITSNEIKTVIKKKKKSFHREHLRPSQLHQHGLPNTEVK